MRDVEKLCSIELGIKALIHNLYIGCLMAHCFSLLQHKENGIS